MMKKILLSLLAVVLVLVASGYWAYSLIDRDAFKHDIKNTQKAELPYITENVPEQRGNILAVVTSHSELGDTGKTLSMN